MRDVPKHRTTRQRNARTSGASAQAGEPRQPRGARRKRETRMRMLEAALRLMAEKGMDCVAIDEITEAADVGFGSFCNHFESKEGIFAALIEWVFEEFADALDCLVSGLSDPAEVVAVCVRHTLMRARNEPVWGQFLVREGFSAHALHRGLGQWLRRDSERGIAEKRFVVTDPLMTILSVTGTVLAAIAAELHSAASLLPSSRRQKTLGVGDERFPERAAVVVLQVLRLARAVAENIAARPLPVAGLEFDAGGEAAR
ncbi:TetR/AcrR family transcriptional regulator [Burkholderia sp. PU8-34]